MAVKDWILLPNSDFRARENWQILGNNEFAAFRGSLLVLRTYGKKHCYGHPISQHNLSPTHEIVLKTNRQRVIISTDTISHAIRFVATSRISNQLIAKVSSELSSKLPGFQGKLKSEASDKNEYEITEELEKALNLTTSHVVQELDESEHSNYSEAERNAT
ncbi:MAG: hypothetical protein K0Q83_2917 [Deltaproteobacteria bacterium]|jgi:hypothetical protein|nr:hypothetical protein [Deltaproteobacteria bacterium]